MAESLHEKRGVTFAELGALLGTRQMLETGVLKTRDYADAGDDPETTRCHLFDMNHPGEVNEHCGSVGCIGGTMAMIMRLPPKSYVIGRKHGPLGDLFYPPEDLSRCWEDISPEEAIAAIDNWLEDGHARWEDIVTE